MTAIVGYARTSTVEQEAGLEDQKAELLNHGCTKLFVESVSGVDAKRPQLLAALDYVREGDVFVVTKPDRLARSTKDLLDITEGLEKRGVTVRVLSMNIDTSTATGKLLLGILAQIAQFERDLMLERQRAGIAAAKAKGLYKGRAPTARNRTAEVLGLKGDGLSASDIITKTGLSKASVYRILKGADAR